MKRSLVQEKFGAAAADYAASAVHAKGPSLGRVVGLVSPQRDWRVLDVATGAGHTALAFAPHVAHVIASDITDEMLKEAGGLAAAKGLENVETAHASADALAFPDASFDLVTCRLAAHHFPNVDGFVAEAWRVLAPGGTFALIDNVSPDTTLLPGSSEAVLSACVDAYNAFERLRDPSHGSCLQLSAWLSLMQKTGFEIAHQEYMDQEIVFAPWIARMRCDKATAERLNAMLLEEPLAAFLKPHDSEDGFAFTLQEAIVIARKPG